MALSAHYGVTMADDNKISITDRVLLGERDAEIAYLKNRTLVLAQLLEQTTADLVEAQKELSGLREHIANKLTGLEPGVETT